MSERKRNSEIEITDKQSPEVRDLINEFGFKIIMTAVSFGCTDPVKLRQFAQANLRRAQEALEKSCTGFADHFLLGRRIP